MPTTAGAAGQVGLPRRTHREPAPGPRETDHTGSCGGMHKEGIVGLAGGATPGRALWVSDGAWSGTGSGGKMGWGRAHLVALPCRVLGRGGSVGVGGWEACWRRDLGEWVGTARVRRGGGGGGARRCTSTQLLVGMHGEGRRRERVVGVGIFGGACAGSWGGKGAVGTGMVLHFVARCLQGSGKHGEGGRRKSGRSGCLWRCVRGGKLGWDGAFVWQGSGHQGGSLGRLASPCRAPGRAGDGIGRSGVFGWRVVGGSLGGISRSAGGGGMGCPPSLALAHRRQRQRGRGSIGACGRCVLRSGSGGFRSGR